MVSIELIQFLLCAPVDQVLPKDLGGLLTAIVLITMAVTPLLGQMAEIASETFASTTVSPEVRELVVEEGQVAENSIVVCGYGEVGKVLVNKLGAAIDYDADGEEGEESSSSNKNNILPQVVVFDTKPSLINKTLMPRPNVAVMYGDGENPEILHSHGVTSPKAIFISYEQHEQVMAATSRLRASFAEAPISRAQSRQEAEELKCAGATEVVVELDSLAQSSPALLLTEEVCGIDGRKAIT